MSTLHNVVTEIVAYVKKKSILAATDVIHLNISYCEIVMYDTIIKPMCQ